MEKEHVISMDNYFSSIPLLKELLLEGFMQQGIALLEHYYALKSRKPHILVSKNMY